MWQFCYWSQQIKPALSKKSNSEHSSAFFNSVVAERGEEATEVKFKSSTGWFVSFRGKNHFHNIKEQGKTAHVDAEAAASYAEILK